MDQKSKVVASHAQIRSLYVQKLDFPVHVNNMCKTWHKHIFTKKKKKYFCHSTLLENAPFSPITIESLLEKNANPF